MNKDQLENRLQKLEKELNSLKSEKEKKNLYIFKNLINQYSKKQIFSFSLALFILAGLISVAGPVTKQYTFTDGELASAEKFNANFEWQKQSHNMF